MLYPLHTIQLGDIWIWDIRVSGLGVPGSRDRGYWVKGYGFGLRVYTVCGHTPLQGRGYRKQRLGEWGISVHDIPAYALGL
jgi:hypothetical protein